MESSGYLWMGGHVGRDKRERERGIQWSGCMRVW